MVNTMTKNTLGWKGLILLILPGDSPSLREVIVGTQGEQALGGRNCDRGHGSLAYLSGLAQPAFLQYSGSSPGVAGSIYDFKTVPH